MSNETIQRVDRALLIGIDKYQYIAPDLDGCVGDVRAMRAFLMDTLKTPAERITTLTASRAGTEAPAELATRANIVAAFLQLADAAQKGEQIYIQYSGHGMRNDSTLLPGLEADGRDEAIAPTDSGYQDPAAFYLLDKELGWLIRRITDKGTFVTMTMDCCHSASGTRALAKVRRGQRRSETGQRLGSWEGGDPRPRPDATLVAPLDQLRLVLAAPEGAPGSLLPAPRGYVLLTACREQETAKEYADAHGSSGVFTHFLLERLAQGTAGLTYRTLVDCAAARILELSSSRPDYSFQTPQLEGDGSLIVFGGGASAAPRAMIAAPQADGTLRITGGGAAVGMTVGTTIGLYPPDAQKLDDPSAQIGVATVTQVHADASVARVESAQQGALQAGMKAVVIRPGSVKVRRSVGLGEGAALAKVKDAIERHGRDGKGSPYVKAVPDAPDAQPELVVLVQGGAYVIADHTGTPLPRISPPLLVDAPDSPDKVVQRLEHVVQYLNAWELKGDDASGLRNKVAISVVRNHGRGAGTVSLRVGESISVRGHNRTGRPLSAALLYFGPDWHLERIWPEGVDYTELAPTAEEGLALVNLDVSLPEGVDSATERLKLIVTEKPTSFAALELASLDRRRAVRATRGAGNPLEQMLEAIGEGWNTRELTRRTGTGDWATAEVTLETTR